MTWQIKCHRDRGKSWQNTIKNAQVRANCVLVQQKNNLPTHEQNSAAARCCHTYISRMVHACALIVVDGYIIARQTETIWWKTAAQNWMNKVSDVLSEWWYELCNACLGGGDCWWRLRSSGPLIKNAQHTNTVRNAGDVWMDGNVRGKCACKKTIRRHNTINAQ